MMCPAALTIRTRDPVVPWSMAMMYFSKDHSPELMMIAALIGDAVFR
jgi:hypothetical protein